MVDKYTSNEASIFLRLAMYASFGLSVVMMNASYNPGMYLPVFGLSFPPNEISSKIASGGLWRYCSNLLAPLRGILGAIGRCTESELTVGSVMYMRSSNMRVFTSEAQRYRMMRASLIKKAALWLRTISLKLRPPNYFGLDSPRTLA